MKQYGLLGKGTGKLGSSVFAISGGEQIVREYNPKVSNPNTALQIEQRAKFKLMSQLAAAFAPFFGFTKKGLTSARNAFVAKNIPLVEYNTTNGASVNLDKIALTPSAVRPLGCILDFDEQNDRGAFIPEQRFIDEYDAVVLASIIEEDGKVSINDTKLVKTADMTAETGVYINLGSGKNVCYAYALKYPETGSSTSYSDYLIAEGQIVAKLNGLTSLLKSGAVCTESISKTMVMA